MSPTSIPKSPRGMSLGHGSFPPGGPITFSQSKIASTGLAAPLQNPTQKESPSVDTNDTLPSARSLSELDDDSPISTRKPKQSPLAALTKKLAIGRTVRFERHVSSFMRSADLGLSQASHSFHNNEDEIHENFHHPSATPPPGMHRDTNEAWVALDNGAGSHSPVAPSAIHALAEVGLSSAMNQSMWIPEKKTEKLLRATSGTDWSSCAWEDTEPMRPPSRDSAAEQEVLVWYGTFKHSFYGGDLPAVRAFGIVNMSAKALMELLVDSARVQEYNKMSLGRKDLLILQDDMCSDGPFGLSITKVMQSESKPPLLRKIMRFVTLLHARELENDAGYLIVSRAVTQASDSGAVESNILKSEILLGVNVIRKIKGDDSRCIMINVNHICSPMVPMMIAKKLGLTAASNFIRDIRKLC